MTGRHVSERVGAITLWDHDCIAWPNLLQRIGSEALFSAPYEHWPERRVSRRSAYFLSRLCSLSASDAFSFSPRHQPRNVQSFTGKASADTGGQSLTISRHPSGVSSGRSARHTI